MRPANAGRFLIERASALSRPQLPVRAMDKCPIAPLHDTDYGCDIRDLRHSAK